MRRFKACVLRTEAFDVTTIVVFSLLSLGVLIANPGYYSHDELQKLDHVARFGIGDYIRHYVVLARPEAFGTPVRPLAFLVQGGLALFMQNYPVVVHFMDVLPHVIVAVLLYVLALRYSQDRLLALWAALIFAICPMTIIATGWSAALMDRWYVLFGMLAFLCADAYVRRDEGGSFLTLALVFICGTLAVLSKETALVLPATTILMLVRYPKLNLRRFVIATGIWFLPSLLFFLYRLPSLVGSFGAHDQGPYGPSLANAPSGLLVYFTYPFLFGITEANNWVFFSSLRLILAAFVHGCLILCIFVRGGARATFAYVFLYFLFLLPVLLIPTRGAHYLYGSSLVFSVGLAYLLRGARGWPSWLQGLVGVMVVCLTIQAAYLEAFVYSIGSCMNSALIGLQSAYLSHGRPQIVDLRAELGAPAHVLYRFTTGRSQIGADYPVKFVVSEWGAERTKDAVTLAMNKECIVYSLPPE
ncbi:hypothetical protein [Rhizobium sp. YTU87027]|uniref:hypothetical protein n=1 Tax=Rhizobium sp. YTU87027 TaxID=3417741 RepID=UPI003D69C60C